jgi:hypothetical protein
MFELGAVYPAALNITDGNGQPADPVSVSLIITQPDQTTVNCTVPLPSAVPGQLRYPFPTVQPGRHLVNWTTSNPATAYTDVFDVLEAAPPSLFSLADAKVTLSMDPAYTADDDELRSKIRAVTRSLERVMHTVYAWRQVTETIPQPLFPSPWGLSAKLRLTFVPVLALTSLVTMSPQNTVTTTYDTVNNMYVDAETGLVHRYAGPPFAGRMIAGYTAGYQIIPSNVLEGGLILLQHIWESRRGPGGLNGVIGPEEMADFRHFTALPRKVQDLLGPPRPVVY